MSNAAAYDADLVLWAEDQARALRGATAVSNLSIDWKNVAEEIEALARSERSSLANHIATVIEHLAKLQASPATNPRVGWQMTVLRARAAISELLETSPGMKPSVEAVVQRRHDPALNLVSRELALRGEPLRIPVAQIRYTSDQVLSDWWPDGV